MAKPSKKFYTKTSKLASKVMHVLLVARRICMLLKHMDVRMVYVIIAFLLALLYGICQEEVIL